MTEDLTASDLASTSPYNTRNPNSRGLPAGPICSPSLASLKAAANPSSASYLYFFYSESTNQVYFFNTQQEFDAAWAKRGQSVNASQARCILHVGARHRRLVACHAGGPCRVPRPGQHDSSARAACGPREHRGMGKGAQGRGPQGLPFVELQQAQSGRSCASAGAARHSGGKKATRAWLRGSA